MNPLQLAVSLFDGLLPEGTTVTVEVHKGYRGIPTQYVFYAIYVAKSSGRTLGICAKGETLPQEHDDVFNFYLRQLAMNPSELAREFSRVYFLERRARQDAFLRGESGNIRVSGKSIKEGETDGAEDSGKLKFAEYA